MKVLICDDHKIVRVGIRYLLEQMPEVKEIEEAENGNEAISILRSKEFNFVLLDISLPGISGLEVLQQIKANWHHINVLVLSMHPQEQYAVRALKLGASGYLTKDTASEELLIAIRKIAAGGKYISLSMAENIALYIDDETVGQGHASLSKREFEIMIMLANGKSLLEIGNELFISNKTVSTYRTRIMAKMEMTKNTELTKYCMENQLI